MATEIYDYDKVNREKSTDSLTKRIAYAIEGADGDFDGNSALEAYDFLDNFACRLYQTTTGRAPLPADIEVLRILHSVELILVGLQKHLDLPPLTSTEERERRQKRLKLGRRRREKGLKEFKAT